MSQQSSSSRTERFRVKDKRQGRVKSFGHISVQHNIGSLREKFEEKANEVEDDVIFGDRNMNVPHDKTSIGGKQYSLENTATNFSMRTTRYAATGYNESKKQNFTRRLHELSAPSDHRKVPSFDINEFYLTRLTDNAKASKNFRLDNSPRESETSCNFLNKKRGQLESIIEKAETEFDSRMRKHVSQHVFLSFPMEVRSFVEEQTSKVKTTLKSHLLRFEKKMHCLSTVDSMISTYKPELGNACKQVSEDIRQSWMTIINFMVKIVKQQAEIEHQARNAIMQSHKDDSKENTMLKLQVAALKEMIEFKETNIQMLQSTVDAKELEIKELKESKMTMTLMTQQANADNDKIERQDCLIRLQTIQDEIKKLSAEYQQIEEQKKIQDLSMMRLRVLTRENVLSGPREIGVQVDEYELQWGVKSLMLEVRLNPDFTHLNDKVSSLVLNPVATFEDPLLKVTGNNSTISGSMNNDTLSISSLPFSEMTIDRKKKQPIKKKKQIVIENQSSIIWQIPFGLCSFLEQINQLYTEVSVVMWNKFRQEIYTLLDARLNDDWEIVSSPTNAVIPFEEYIILYFVKSTPHPRTAPLKLLEFLSSLKFYAQKWRRAYLCALICNLIRRKELGIYDIYLQNYYLFVYAKFSSFREFQEDDDQGSTFLHCDKVTELLTVCLEFLDGERYHREISGMQMKAQIINGKEGYLDIDEVMLTCVNLFLEEYQKRCETAKKHMKSQINKKSALGVKFADFCKVQEDSYFQKTNLKHLSFPAELTKARAYVLYRNLCGNLKRQPEECFEIALKRYGLAIPFPLYIGEINIRLFPSESNLKRSKELLPLSKGLTAKPSPRVENLKKDATDKGGKKRVFHNTLEKLKFEEKEEGKKRLSIYALDNRSPPESPTSPRRKNKIEDETLNSPTRSVRPGDLEDKAEISSSLIAQHFSILRELSQYCSLLKENVGPDSSNFNPEEVWKNFNHLVELLDAGCDFLHYPVKL